ncbi:ABC1 kinase family protein [Paratractidigestivibacter sp.]|uniref:ABC1 kinase family protein n=1 Tax=Paratractidigestivibacter sp. TaxID=2847316 RepID=UPI002AC8E29F|nr:AarF/UbiB family protein [Paratractidigestivibacter sp.]
MASEDIKDQAGPTAADDFAGGRRPDYDRILNTWYEEVSQGLDDDGPDTIGLFGGRAKDTSKYDLTRSSRMRRIGEIMAIVRRYDIFHGLTPEGLRQMLEELGPTFVKAGQILSMRSEILPPTFTRELSRLRTEVEPMDRETVLQALRDEYDEPIEDIFDAIDDNPLGSASVAQVHKARLVTGELVAIKVQRPHVQEVMAKDISIMRSLARRLGGFMGADQFLDLKSVVDELWQSFREETDFLVEARNLEEFRRNNAGCAFLSCPKPYPKLCTRHVVVMDYVEGVAIDDTVTLAALGYDVAEIGEKLMDNYTSQMLDDGFFHADPHPGNLVVSEGKIVYLDLGIMGRLSAGDRAAVSDMVMAVATRDSAALEEGLLRFSSSDPTEIDHAHLLGELDAIIANYGAADLSELDIGAFVNSLLNMARKNGIEMPGSVTMLARALVTLEGVVDNLLPNASMVDIIRRHLRAHESMSDLAAREAKRYAREGAAASHGLLMAASEAGHAMHMLTRGQLRMNLDIAGTEDPFGDLGHIVDRLTLGIIAAGLFIGSSVIYYARIQPVIFGIPIIGFAGFVIALVIGLYVAHEILSEGRSKKRR